MHRIKNVLTNRVLKNSLGDQGTWLPVRLTVTYMYTLLSLQLPSTLLILLHNPGLFISYVKRMIRVNELLRRS